MRLWTIKCTDAKETYLIINGYFKSLIKLVTYHGIVINVTWLLHHIMPHGYNTRNKKAEMSQESLDKLEQTTVNSINSLKDETKNLKDIVFNKIKMLA